VSHLLTPYAGALPVQAAADIAASFQAAVTDVLADRTEHALRAMPQATTLVVAGGVAANQAIRTALTTLAARYNLPLAAPPLRLCGDNAVMVAWAAIERLRAGLALGMEAPARPRWPLEATGA
jgi:N6-L-threonylcarbamoyladenine synthase